MSICLFNSVIVSAIYFRFRRLVPVVDRRRNQFLNLHVLRLEKYNNRF